MRYLLPILVVLLGFGLSPLAQARIQLVALPEREETIVRLDHPDVTLVEEERVLALQQGVTRVDFSWRGVRIDPDSIRLQILSHPGVVKLLNVSYPPGEDALVWEIAAPEALQERVRIAYLLGGIDRLVEHKARVGRDEKTLELQPHLIIRNFSGEAFSPAYFVIQGDEGFQREMQHEETKRLLLARIPGVRFEKTFTWDAESQPHDPKRVEGNVGLPVHYVLRNDEEHGLGKDPLWAGKVRIEQEDGRGGIVFLGEDMMAFVPVGEKAKLYIGDSRDLVVNQHKLKERRFNVRRNRKGRIVLHDVEEVIRVKLESFMDDPVTVTLLEPMPREWEIVECNFPHEVEHAQRIRFRIPMKPQGKETLTLRYHRRNVR
jgi:hypothetical protein